MLNATIYDENLPGAHISFPTTAAKLENALSSIHFEPERIADYSIHINDFPSPELRYFRANMPDEIPLNSVDDLNYFAHLLKGMEETTLIKFEAVCDGIFHKDLEATFAGGTPYYLAEKDLSAMIDIAHNLGRFTHYDGAHDFTAVGQYYANDDLLDREQWMGEFSKFFNRHFDFEKYGHFLHSNKLHGSFSREGYVFGGQDFQRVYPHRSKVPKRAAVWNRVCRALVPDAITPEELKKRLEAAKEAVPYFASQDSVAIAKEVLVELEAAGHPWVEEPAALEMTAFCIQVGDPAVTDTIEMIMNAENQNRLYDLYARVVDCNQGENMAKQLNQPAPAEWRALVTLPADLPAKFHTDDYFLDRLSKVAHYKPIVDTFKEKAAVPLKSWCEQNGIQGFELLSPYQQQAAEEVYRAVTTRFKTVYYHAEAILPVIQDSWKQYMDKHQEDAPNGVKKSILQQLKDDRQDERPTAQDNTKSKDKGR